MPARSLTTEQRIAAIHDLLWGILRVLACPECGGTGNILMPVESSTPAWRTCECRISAQEILEGGRWWEREGF